jgi:hypothetical protein
MMLAKLIAMASRMTPPIATHGMSRNSQRIAILIVMFVELAKHAERRGEAAPALRVGT